MGRFSGKHPASAHTSADALPGQDKNDRLRDIGDARTELESAIADPAGAPGGGARGDASQGGFSGGRGLAAYLAGFAGAR